MPALPPHPGPYRVQPRRSLADIANERLGVKKPKDPLAEGMEDAKRDDCLHAPDKPQTAGGLLALPGLAIRGMTDKCAK